MLDTTKINKHCEANALEEVQFNTDTWTKSNSSSLELLVIFYDLAIKEIEKSGEKDEIKYRIILNHIISSNHVDRIRSMLTKHTQ